MTSMGNVGSFGSSKATGGDFGSFIAVAFGAPILLLALGLSSYEGDLSELLKAVTFFVESEPALIGWVLFCVALSGTITVLLGLSVLDVGGLGTRLLKNEKKKSVFSISVLVGFSIGLFLGSVIFDSLILDVQGLPNSLVIGFSWVGTAARGFHLISCGYIGAGIGYGADRIFVMSGKSHSLPPYPKFKNTLVLGTEGELYE